MMYTCSKCKQVVTSKNHKGPMQCSNGCGPMSTAKPKRAKE